MYAVMNGAKYLKVIFGVATWVDDLEDATKLNTYAAALILSKAYGGSTVEL